MPALSTALIIGGIASAAGSLGSAYLGSNAAGKAATAQSDAANQAAILQKQAADDSLAFQKEIWETQQQQQAPFLGAGTGAINELSWQMGIKPQGTTTTAPGTMGPAPTDPYAEQRAWLTQEVSGGRVGPGGILRQMLAALPPAPQGTMIPGATTTTPGFEGAAGDFGSLRQPWDQKFEAPGADFTQDPGYQFRLAEGQKILERSAAARGNLLTGGTAKALNRYGQDFASNEYGNVYNRALGEYKQNYNIFQGNQANQFNRLAALAGVGQVSANQLGAAGSDAARGVSSINFNAAQGIGNAMQNAAAARASGYVGGANAWGGALSNIGGGLSQYLLLSQILGKNKDEGWV